MMIYRTKTRSWVPRTATTMTLAMTTAMILVMMMLSMDVVSAELKQETSEKKEMKGVTTDKLGRHIECLPSGDDYLTFHCSSVPEPVRIPCTDAKDDECPGWAARGECTKNPQYMLLHCRKSCDTCLPLNSSGSTGSHVLQVAPDPTRQSRTKILQRLIETQEYQWNQANDGTVDMLQKCINKDEMCTHWSITGECKKNPIFMNQQCPAACQTCERL